MAKNIKVPKRIAGVKLKKQHRKKLGSALVLIEAVQALALVGTAAATFLGRGGSKQQHKRARHARP